MSANVEITVQLRVGQREFNAWRRTYDLPAVPRQGDRISVEHNLGGNIPPFAYEVEGVWWSEDHPPLVVLKATIPDANQLGEGWTEVLPRVRFFGSSIHDYPPDDRR